MLDAGQKYYRMLQEDSATLLIFIKLPFVIKNFVLSIYEGPFHTGFTVIYDKKHITKKHKQTEENKSSK